jgi:hypothetical protein
MFAGLAKQNIADGNFGLFASVPVTAGSLVVPSWHEGFYSAIEGWKILTVEEILASPRQRQKLFFRYGLDVDFGRIVGPLAERHVTTLDNFINHSCQPNLTYDLEGNVVAAVEIPRGSELTIDYGCFSINFDEDFTCQCGSLQCRGRVRKNDWSQLALRYRYSMPRFLHSRIQRLLTS